MKKKVDLTHFDAENAHVLAELVVDPMTSDALRVRILNKLLESSEGQNFFATMFNELLSHGECPGCGHENHWLIPEDELNRMGWMTHEQDERVPRMTDVTTCVKWQEACKKKKVNI
jgi:hypothetical protein